MHAAVPAMAYAIHAGLIDSVIVGTQYGLLTMLSASPCIPSCPSRWPAVIVVHKLTWLCSASLAATNTAQHAGSINVHPELATCGSACWCAIMQAQLFATDQAGKGARTVLVSTSNAGERQPYVLVQGCKLPHLLCTRSLAELHRPAGSYHASKMLVTCWHTCVLPSIGIAGNYARDNIAPAEKWLPGAWCVSPRSCFYLVVPRWAIPLLLWRTCSHVTHHYCAVVSITRQQHVGPRVSRAGFQGCGPVGARGGQVGARGC